MGKPSLLAYIGDTGFKCLLFLGWRSIRGSGFALAGGDYIAKEFYSDIYPTANSAVRFYAVRKSGAYSRQA